MELGSYGAETVDSNKGGGGEPRFCRVCGAELDEDGLCSRCGVMVANVLHDKDSNRARLAARDGNNGRWRVILSSLGASILLICAIAGVAQYGVTTAEHWEKVDNPGKMIDRETGYYIVSMTDEPVCYIGQDWTECVNAYIAEYNRECTKPMKPEQTESAVSLSTSEVGLFYEQVGLVKLKPFNQRLCARYSEMIDEMQAADRPGSYVSSLGDWGRLESSPDTERVRVGYESHDAVCYFGFLGECPEDDGDE